MKIFVAFEDSSEIKVVASFSCAQEIEAWHYQGVIEDSDDRWKDYMELFSDGNPLIPV